jgi:hypothetical protein
LFLDGLRALAIEPGGTARAHVDFLEDFQLQVEHALDLAQRQRVLFVDASLDCRAPFEWRSLAPARDSSFTTHAVSPESLLQVYCDLNGTEPPPCELLAIRGASFGLGEPLGALGASHLDLALQWGRRWLLAHAASADAAAARIGAACIVA